MLDRCSQFSRFGRERRPTPLGYERPAWPPDKPRTRPCWQGGVRLYETRLMRGGASNKPRCDHFTRQLRSNEPRTSATHRLATAVRARCARRHKIRIKCQAKGRRIAADRVKFGTSRFWATPPEKHRATEGPEQSGLSLRLGARFANSHIARILWIGRLARRGRSPLEPNLLNWTLK